LIVEIEKSIKALEKGDIILLPTDTIWGICCDATNTKAINNISKLKKRTKEKSFICLVSKIELLEKIIGSISEKILKILTQSKKPTSFIFPNGRNLSKNVFARDGSIAVRFVKNGFCKKLIDKYNKPIIATSANISGEKFPKNYYEIDYKIIEGVDYIVAINKNRELDKASRIVKINSNNKIVEIRK
tara:strand:- start:895 stop:1455 length:561 start_codon:yes stop_codon:yes gene_type:complete